MVDFREQLIDNLCGHLFADNLLNTQDYFDTDALIDDVKAVITSDLEDITLVRGRVLE